MRSTLIEARGNRTQTDVSAEIGISQKYLSKLELGQRTPSLKVAVKIASYYKKSVEYLFPDIILFNVSPKSSNEWIITEEGEKENGKYNGSNEFKYLLSSTLQSFNT